MKTNDTPYPSTPLQSDAPMCIRSRRRLPALAIAASVICAALPFVSLRAQDAVNGVKVESTFVRAVPPNSTATATAAFMTLVNDSDSRRT